MVVRACLVQRRRDDRLGALTPRERKVLAKGRTNAGIADPHLITEGAAEKHISNNIGRLDLPGSVDGHRPVLAVLSHFESA